MSLTKATFSMIDGAAVNVRDFGAAGDGVTDDTAAFIAAMASSGKTIWLPSGTYLTDFGNPEYSPNMILEIPSGTHFVGEGETTIWRPYTNNPGSEAGTDAYGCIGTDSGSVSVWSEDISFSNIKFKGYSETTNTVQQHSGLIFLSSVKRVNIVGCYFEAPRGDAIYISSGYGAGASYERHNYDVTIRDCVFDGVNNKNRNAITVIDCTNLTIDGCVFKNFSDSSMPGCIDLEPDDTYSIVKNITITNNKFSTSLGARGHISVSMGYSHNFQNLIVANNTFNGNEAVRIDTKSTSEPTVNHNVVVANNTAVDCTYLWRHEFGSIWGVEITGNISYSPSAGGRIVFGSNNSGRTHKQITIADNQLTGNSSTGLVIYDNIQSVQMHNNIFTGYTNAHVRLGVTGDGTSSTEVSIIGNDFRGAPSQGAILHQNDTPNALTNVFARNYIPVGTTHGFKATMTDNVGNTVNTFTATNIPSDFAYGEHMTAISAGSIIGSGTDYGLLYTHKQLSSGASYTWQEYKPATGADLAKRLYRTASGAGTWGSWYTLTGV